MKFKYLLFFLFLSENITDYRSEQDIFLGGILHYDLSDSFSCGGICEFHLLSDLINPFYSKDISRTRNKNYVSVGCSFLKILDEKMIDSVLFGFNFGISRELINNNFFHLNLKAAEFFINFNFFSLLHFSGAIGIFNLRTSLKDARDNSDYKFYIKIGGGGFISNSIEKFTFAAKFTCFEKINIQDIKCKSDNLETGAYLKSQYNRIKKDEKDTLIKYIFDIERKKLLDDKRRNCKCPELTEDEKKILNKIIIKNCKCSELTEDEKKVIIKNISDRVNNKDLCINGVLLYPLIKSCFLQNFESFFNVGYIKSDINESVFKKLIPNEDIRQILEDFMLSFNLDELIYTSDKIDKKEELVCQSVKDDESKKKMILNKESIEINKKIIKFILDEKGKFNNWIKIADFIKEDIINEEIIKSDISFSSYTRCLIDGYKNFYKNACDDEKIYIRNLTFLHLYKDIMKHVETSTVFGQSEDFKYFMLSNGCLDFSINDIS